MTNSFAKVQLLMNAADFYVVPGLKRLCEQWLVETLNTTNMVDRYDSLFPRCLFLEFHNTGLSWEIHTTQWTWGELRRRCCWPTPRSLTWSQTGGRSCPPGLSLPLRCSESLLGTLCEVSVAETLSLFMEICFENLTPESFDHFIICIISCHYIQCYQACVPIKVHTEYLI